MPKSNEELWDDYLTALELDYTYAAARHVAPEPATAPANLGLLPDVWVERAARLRRMQEELLTSLVAEQREVGKQLAALRQVPRETKTPVYLDLAG